MTTRKPLAPRVSLEGVKPGTWVYRGSIVVISFQIVVSNN